MWIRALVLLLLLAAAVSVFLRQRGVRTAYIWLLISSISLVVWLLLVLIPVESAKPFEIRDWFQLGGLTITLQFGMSRQNWPLIFAVAAFNLSFFLTAVVRLDIRTDLKYWLVQLNMTCLAILALSARNSWTLLILWTALDILNFFYHYQVSKSAYSIQIFRSMMIRFVGSMVLIWNIAGMQAGGINFPLDLIPQGAGLSMFLAALLHSGILPINVQDEKSRTETDRIVQRGFKINNFVTSFAFVQFLEAPEMAMFTGFLVRLIALLITVIFSYQWMVRKTLVGFDYLLAAGSGFLFLLYISGLPIAVTFSLVTFMFLTTCLTLFTHRGRSLMVFPVLAFLIASGLPFSVLSMGSRGFFYQGGFIESYLLLIPFGFLLAGFLVKSKDQQKMFPELEPWYQTVYLAGLFLFIFSMLIIVIIQVTSPFAEIEKWWMGLGIAVFSVALFAYVERKNRLRTPAYFSSAPKIGGVADVISLSWLFKVFAFSRDKSAKIVSAFSALLEGDGGVLWAIVLLILMISLIRLS
jgi:hypothetical protein